MYCLARKNYSQKVASNQLHMITRTYPKNANRHPPTPEASAGHSERRRIRAKTEGRDETYRDIRRGASFSLQPNYSHCSRLSVFRIGSKYFSSSFAHTKAKNYLANLVVKYTKHFVVTMVAKSIVIQRSKINYSMVFFFTFLFLLALLPLQISFPKIYYFPSDVWNEIRLLAAVYCGFAISYFLRFGKKMRSKISVYLSLLVSFFLAMIASASTIFTLNAQLIFLLLIVWSVPLILSISYNRSRIFALTLIGIFSLHAQWAVIQFSIQDDLGLNLLGESALSDEQTGVAKFAAGSGKLIRAYGPYTHPNSFAGTMVMGLVLAVMLMKSWPASRELHLYLYTVTWVMSFGILLSFSRAGYLGMLILLAVWFWPRGKRLRNALTRLLIIPYVVLVVSLSPLLISRVTDQNDRGVQERLVGLSWAIDVLKEQPLFRGVGIGLYTHRLEDHLQEHDIPHNLWELAPVHSVPLLAASEWGIGWFFIASGAVLVLVSRLRLLLPLLPLAPLILADHYLYTQLAPAIYAVVALAVSYHLTHAENTGFRANS